MAGLLSGLMSGQFTDDPEQNKLITQGLLNFGLRLMSSKGPLGPSVGQSGLGAIQGMNEYKQQTYLEKLRKQEQEEYERRKKQRGLEEQFRQELPSPEMLASQNALAGGGGPTVENAAKIQPVDPYQSMMAKAVKAGLVSPLDWMKMNQKDESAHVVTPGATLIRGNRQIFSAPEKTPPDPEKWRLYKLSGAEARGIGFDDWNRANLKSGATNVSVSADKGFAGALGKNVADALQAGQDAAISAQASNATIDAIRQAAKSGSVILGPGATVRQIMLRLGQVSGVGTTDAAQSLARTKEVEQGLARIELEAANLIKGQGQVTEAERGIVRRAAAGQIQDLTDKELEVALNAIERNNNAKIKNYTTKTKLVQGNPATGTLGPLLDTPTQQPSNVVDWSSLGR